MKNFIIFLAVVIVVLALSSDLNPSIGGGGSVDASDYYTDRYRDEVREYR